MNLEAKILLKKVQKQEKKNWRRKRNSSTDDL
jgi:hypothetical protein